MIHLHQAHSLNLLVNVRQNTINILSIVIRSKRSIFIIHLLKLIFPTSLASLRGLFKGTSALTPSWYSKPSTVYCCGHAITPALFTCPNHNQRLLLGAHSKLYGMFAFNLVLLENISNKLFD